MHWLNSNHFISQSPWCPLSTLPCRSSWRFLAGRDCSRPWPWPVWSETDDRCLQHPPAGRCHQALSKYGRYGTGAPAHTYRENTGHFKMIPKPPSSSGDIHYIHHHYLQPSLALLVFYTEKVNQVSIHPPNPSLLSYSAAKTRLFSLNRDVKPPNQWPMLQ